MNEIEIGLAMDALNAAYPYAPMVKPQPGQYRRLFAGYSVEVVRGVLDDLIDHGIKNRPGPAEMGEMLRSWMRSHARKIEPAAPTPAEVMAAAPTPPELVSTRVAELRQCLAAS